MGSRLIPQKSHEILSAQNVIFEEKLGFDQEWP